MASSLPVQRLADSAARGRLRIYLGYAPGGGTTCALLSEGRRRAEYGIDVAVASASPDLDRRPVLSLLPGCVRCLVRLIGVMRWLGGPPGHLINRIVPIHRGKRRNPSAGHRLRGTHGVCDIRRTGVTPAT
jgi:two-component system, OmpR family, sensor histidine kinase KdpD